MPEFPDELDLILLREAAQAGFHATPPTVLALLDLIVDYRERWRALIEATLGADVEPFEADR